MRSYDRVAISTKCDTVIEANLSLQKNWFLLYYKQISAVFTDLTNIGWKLEMESRHGSCRVVQRCKMYVSTKLKAENRVYSTVKLE